MSKKSQIIWKAVEYEGLEHLYLREQRTLVQAVSTVISVVDGRPLRLDYTLECDERYVMHQLNVSLFDGRHLVLNRDSHGNWINEIRTLLPELDGCIDVDISATPFTNTLPIRRIEWQVGQSEIFKMVYILVPDLTVSVMRQRYTCLAKHDQGATFRYENVDDDFKADITVDSDGLVVHYPDLFERVI